VASSNPRRRKQAVPVREWPRPANKKAVRDFMGLTGYFWHFIPNYSTIAAPLTDLTHKSEPVQVVWTDRAEKAFNELKTVLCTNPVLRMPDFNMPFTIFTDTSDTGIWAMLSQGEEHPFVYISNKLSPRERNYTTAEREAIKRVLVYLRCYLLGRSFHVVPNHTPLKWMAGQRDNNEMVISTEAV
jgi:hypothetical protein